MRPSHNQQKNGTENGLVFFFLLPNKKKDRRGLLLKTSEAVLPTIRGEERKKDDNDMNFIFMCIRRHSLLLFFEAREETRVDLGVVKEKEKRDSISRPGAVHSPVEQPIFVRHDTHAVVLDHRLPISCHRLVRQTRGKRRKDPVL